MERDWEIILMYETWVGLGLGAQSQSLSFFLLDCLLELDNVTLVSVILGCAIADL